MPAAELEAFVDGQVMRAMQADHLAGVAVSVVQNGQLVMEKGYGSASLRPVRRMDARSTLVRLGSTSQIFTWIVALKAVEDGRLNFDAPVNGYLPNDLKIPDEGFGAPILFRHLMSHTAGFEDRALGRRYVVNPDNILPLDAALRQLKPRRVRAPGVLSVPSDYGVALAGRVVSQIDGRPFDQLIETTVLKPLALSHTTFREPYPARNGLPDPVAPSLSNALSQGFIWDARGLTPAPFAYAQSLAPALSASTTADDMARLMIALLNNGHMGAASIYGPKAAALLRTPLQHPAQGVQGWDHGLAVQRLPDGLEMLTDSGADVAFRSNMALVPSMGLGVFVSANTDTGAALAADLPAAVIQRFYGAPETAHAPGDAETSFQGRYLSAKRAYHGLEAFADRLTRQSTLTADAATGGVVLKADGQSRLFAPTGTPGRFQTTAGTELLTPSEDGKAQAYVLGSGGGAAERVGGIHSEATLAFWGGATVLTVLATFAGLFIRERNDPRETRRQIAANVTQILTCIVWCAAFGALGLVARKGLTPANLMFDWPNTGLVTASWAALVAGLLSLLMATQLPGAWREERRIHGWSIWRKIRHTATVGVFLVFTAILAAWGALEPWSS
jgi:CubicO group peptidase (beta-lactamase class C family)